MSSKVVSTRSELLSLLSEACELEHGLACSYLFTAFTLKQDTGEGGISWEQLQKVRLWAGQIYFVASQEMLHLAQAWNLLAAVGGTPYYLRPNFPQELRYYSFGHPLTLEPFGRNALQRFRLYESPLQVSPERSFFKELGVAPGFRTVGELYEQIAAGFRRVPEERLFIGIRERQVDERLADFPDLVRVVDRESALLAIENITRQGEGTVADRTDSHFGMFTETLRQFEAESEASRQRGDEFKPARDTIENPVARYRGNYGAARGNLIEEPYTQQVAELFDSTYGLMLRMLQYVFDNSTGDAALLRDFSQMAIRVMPTVLKPFGEALTLLPAGASYDSKTAGPAFGLSRHVPLPVEPSTAATVVQEQLAEVISLAEKLAAHARAPVQLASGYNNLKHLL
jgi:hypothetical protein